MDSREFSPGRAEFRAVRHLFRLESSSILVPTTRITPGFLGQGHLRTGDGFRTHVRRFLTVYFWLDQAALRALFEPFGGVLALLHRGASAARDPHAAAPALRPVPAGVLRLVGLDHRGRGRGGPVDLARRLGASGALLAHLLRAHPAAAKAAEAHEGLPEPPAIAAGLGRGELLPRRGKAVERA